MDPRLPIERWAEVDGIFAAALDRRPEDRASYVEKACAGDPSLLEAVRAALDAAEESERFLETCGGFLVGPALRQLAEDAVEEERREAPERIGRYRVVGELGRGGWGTVYSAERDAGDFKQRVAIKLLRRGLDTDDVLARFRAEGQILASLTHPNIARLLDGGAAGDGRPYLVMELVEGVPITDYCEANRLGVRERLALLVGVGRAVQYAHRNLVVHRDLKPSNILVTAEGEVKLLDFGIAKLLDEAAEGGAPATRTGARPMTPGYASPEQVLGGPITTASDVYQLGLLLYELLTGRRPYGESDGSRRRWEERVAAEVPDAPSAVVLRTRGRAERAHARQLRGDLDTIALKALRREPERRYATVAELIEDVRRHLEGQPVRARPDTWSYRTWKLVRRRPGAAAAGVAALLAAGAYLGTLQAHAAQLEMERDRARVEADKARQVAAFMTDVFTLSGPNVTKGEAVTARELLDEATRRLRSGLADQPAVRAALLSAVARVYQDYGLNDRALELFTEATMVRAPVAAEHPTDHAGDLRAMAYLLERVDAGRSDSLYREALRLARGVSDPTYPITGRILVDYGHSLSFRKAVPDDSVWSMYRRAVEILRGSSADVRRDLAHALTISAYGLAPTDRWFDGSTPLERMRESLDLRIDLLGEESIDVASGLSDLALAVEEIDSEESVRLLTRAVGILDKLVQKRHPLALTLLSNLAAVHWARGEPALAEPLFREAIAISEESFPELPNNAYALSHLGGLLAAEGRGTEAEPLLREALRKFEWMQMKPDDRRILTTRARLAAALVAQRRHAEAERELLAAEALLPPAGNPPGAEAVLSGLAGLYDASGRADRADHFRAELVRRTPR